MSKINNNSNIEQLIQEQSPYIADQMLKIANSAGSEEDVRHECNTLLDAFLRKAGIQVKGQHEYGLAGRRIDSKYGGVIIEYKYPKGAGKITENPHAPGTKAVIKQIQRRFKDFQNEENIEPDRIFGVGCDGDTLVFVRHRGGKFEPDDPQPTTRHTVERLLRALISLGAQGHSFTPEHLANDFGADSPLAQQGIRDIYSVICETKNQKAITFFKQWQILYSEVCGYEVTGDNTKIEELGAHYGIPNARPAELLFSVHTYYAIFMKFLAAEIASSFSPLGVTVIKKCINAPTIDKLRTEMESLEQGGIWSQLGITNFLEGDLFSWYLAAWNERMAEVVRGIVRTLDQYDPTTLSVDPSESRDLLKQLYQHLFPRAVRHDLGEYYTPDWLADHVLNEIGYDGNPDKRLLDPACGSGTFLVMAINRIKTWFEENRSWCGFGEQELVQKILGNVIGFDLNPLAVMAARTNYLLAIRDLIKFASSIEIPVYLCDSITTPTEYGDLFTGGLDKVKQLKTSAGDFLIPTEIANSREQIGKYAEVLEFCVRRRYNADDFIARCLEESLPVVEAELHRSLYQQLLELDANNQNGIWARIIKNAFAPIFTRRVDYVAGNPPWINWRSLPTEYRETIAPLWQTYGLFTQTGLNARLGAGMDDISVLMLFVAADKFLSESGHLGFVITQSIFKSAGGGQGFRRLKLGNNRHLKVDRVSDFSKSQPFEGATTRTSVVSIRLSKSPNTFPVDYRMFSPVKAGKPASEISIGEIDSFFSVIDFEAYPVGADIDSSWITLRPHMFEVFKKVHGKSRYKARIGAHTGGASGVFWIEVLDRANKGVVISNLYDAGRNKVPHITKVVEPDFVRPLLRGKDVSRWSAQSRHHILIPYEVINSGKAVSETTLKRQYPKTYDYFHTFKDFLINTPHYRQHFAPSSQPYWSMYNVGNYTFAPHRVIWREQSSSFKCCVVPEGTGEIYVADHKLIVVECTSDDEAHFLCACLNSAPARFLIQSYAIEIQVSTHVLSHVAVPDFNDSSLHNKLAELSRLCHAAAAKEDESGIAAIELEIDRLAANLWKTTDKELQGIYEALEEMERKK